MNLKIRTYPGMERKRLKDILSAVRKTRVALLGDLCLDVYWQADMRLSELSRETPHHPLPIVEERMSLGGGGNVGANLAALCPAGLAVIGAVGTDWRGRELKRLLGEQGIGTAGLAEWDSLTTNAYIKPLRAGISGVVYEDPRLDFTMHRPVDSAAEQVILLALEETVNRGIDVLCVSDQMPFGVVTAAVRKRVVQYAREGLTVVVDSRDRIGEYPGAILKPNEVEGARAAGMPLPPDGDIAALAQLADRLATRNDSSVFMTIGAQGSLYYSCAEVWHLPAHAISGPVDFVGAGDSSLAGFSLALAAGADPWEAAYLAGLCSEVTIQKLGTTGTATAGEILQWHSEVAE
ncbi:MAG: bifunctional heptose 7-phosphate kinase/heptose 1-phosphate adenyltransferase [Oscillospiraceae bacterium]